MPPAASDITRKGKWEMAQSMAKSTDWNAIWLAARERMRREGRSHVPRSVLPRSRERDVRASGVPTGLTPLGRTVPHQPQGHRADLIGVVLIGG